MESFLDYIKKKEKEAFKKTLNHSYSDTDLFLSKLNKEKEEEKEPFSLRTEINTIAKKKDNSNVKNPSSIQMKKIEIKDKRRLRDYIINNEKYLQLYGNKRYKDKSPILYVQDHKKNRVHKTTGLLPVPNKSKKKIKNADEEKQLYEIQRSCVMVRRFQYNEKFRNKSKNSTNNKKSVSQQFLNKYVEQMGKIILIQKIFRGYFTRKRIWPFINFLKYMSKVDLYLFRIYLKNAFRKLIKFTTFKKDVFNNNGFYYSKKNYILDDSIVRKIILIQNKFRGVLASKKLFDILKGQSKIIPKNNDVDNLYYITKSYYRNIKNIYSLVSIIQKKWRIYTIIKLRKHKKIIKPYKITKKIISRPESKVKLIQKWFKRHHYYICLEKEDMLLPIPKVKTWNFFTKLQVYKATQEKLFHKPKKKVEEKYILRPDVYKYNSSYISKIRKYDNILYVEFIQNFIRQIIKPIIISCKYKNSPTFIDKIYVSLFTQKGFKFYKLFKKGWLKKIFKKEIKYKKIKDYNSNDINNIRKIQKLFLNHYYKNKKHIIHRTKFRHGLGYIKKIHLLNNINEIINIQQNYHNHFDKIYNYRQSLIKNKPTNNIICKAEKIYIRDNIQKVIYLSRKIKSFLIIKQLKKEEQERKYIMLPKNKKNFLTKKIFSKYNKNIDIIKLVQHFYKNRFENIKKNTLKPSTRNTRKNKTLYFYMCHNKKNRYDNIGCYISKKRIEYIYGNVLSNAYNKPIIIPNKKICSIQKIHMKNNDNLIMKIQKNISQYLFHRKFFLKKNLPNIIFNTSNQNFLNNIDYDNANLCYYISKSRKINNNNQIRFIQNIYSNKYKTDKENSIIAKEFYKRRFDLDESMNNHILNDYFISKIRIKRETISEYIEMMELQKDPLLIYTKKNQIKYIILLQRKIKAYLNKKRQYKNFMNSLAITNKQNNLFIPFFKKPIIIQKINSKNGIYLTKKIFKKVKKIKNISFISLLNLLSTKKTQEIIFTYIKYYVYPEDITYSSYITKLKNLISYYLSTLSENTQVHKFLSRILGNDLINKKIKPIFLLIKMTKEQFTQLRTQNIYYCLDQDLLNFLKSYCKYFKKPFNEPYIRQRLVIENVYNANIFSLIRFLDQVNDNLINGKYCNKCFLAKCICSKNNDDDEEEEESEYSGDEETNIDNNNLNSKPLTNNNIEISSISLEEKQIIVHPKIVEKNKDSNNQMNSNKKKFNNLNISMSLSNCQMNDEKKNQNNYKDNVYNKNFFNCDYKNSSAKKISYNKK